MKKEIDIYNKRIKKEKPNLKVEIPEWIKILEKE